MTSAPIQSQSVYPYNAAMRGNSGISPTDGWADVARLAAVAAMVVLHMAMGAMAVLPAGGEAWWLANLFDAATRWSVPMLITVSGFLLLAPDRDRGAAAFYRRRAARILPALLFWSLFFVAWTRWTHADPTPGWGELLARLTAGFPYYHLWFLYMLIGLYLVAPVFRRLCDRLDAVPDRRAWGIALLAAFALAAGWQALVWLGGASEPFWPLWFVRFVPFFLLGAWLRRFRSRPSVASAAATGFAAIALTALVYGLAHDAGNHRLAGYIYSYASVSVILMTLALVVVLEHAARWPRLCRFGAALRPLTFGVYLMHPVWIESLQPIWQALLAIHVVPAMLGYALVVFAASLLGTRLLLAIPGLRRVVG